MTTSSKFSEFDFFGQNFNLQFNKRTQYQTTLGASLTFILIASGIALVVTQGLEFIYKEQPIADIVTKFDLNTSLLYINRSSLLLSFAVVDTNFIPRNDPSIFTMTARQFINNQTSKTPFRSLPIKLLNCSDAIEDFEVLNLTRYYEKNHMDSAFCFENGTRIVGGEFNTDYFSNLWVEVKMCKNTTEKGSVVCKPRTTIESILRGGYFEFYFIDSLYVADSFNNPLKKIMKNYFIKLDPQIEKMTEMYFQKIRVLSDNGAFIFEKWEVAEDFTFDFQKEEYQIMQPGGDKIMRFTINSSYNNIEIKRRYLDLVNFAGDMGGILNLLIFLFQIMNSFVIKYKMLEDIFNSLYDFRLEDEDDDGNPSSAKKPIDTKASSILDKFTTLLEERPYYNSFNGYASKVEDSTNQVHRKAAPGFTKMEKFAPGFTPFHKQSKLSKFDIDGSKDFLTLAENKEDLMKKDILNMDKKTPSETKKAFNQNLFLADPEPIETNKRSIKNGEIEMFANPSQLSVSGSYSKDSDDMQNISDINLNSNDNKNENIKSMKKQKNPNENPSNPTTSQNIINSIGQKEFASEKNVIINAQSQKVNKILSEKSDELNASAEGKKTIIVPKRNSDSSYSSDDFQADKKNQINNQLIKKQTDPLTHIKQDNKLASPDLKTRLSQPQILIFSSDAQNKRLSPVKRPDSYWESIISSESEVNSSSFKNKKDAILVVDNLKDIKPANSTNYQEDVKPEGPHKDNDTSNSIFDLGSAAFGTKPPKRTSLKKKSDRLASTNLGKEKRVKTPESNGSLSSDSKKSKPSQNKLTSPKRLLSKFAISDLDDPTIKKNSHEKISNSVAPTGPVVINQAQIFSMEQNKDQKKGGKLTNLGEEYSSYTNEKFNINIDTNLIKEISDKGNMMDTKYYNETESKTLSKERDFLLSKLEDYRSKAKKVLQVSYMDIIGMGCCRCIIPKYKKKHLIFEKTEKESAKYLDYLDIIKLLQEFNKFKVFFMSLSQIKLFSFISKPKIHGGDSNANEEEKNLKNTLIHGKFDDQNLHELYYHYLILKKAKKTKNEKLFNLIDDDILACFEAMRELNI